MQMLGAQRETTSKGKGATQELKKHLQAVTQCQNRAQTKGMQANYIILHVSFNVKVKLLIKAKGARLQYWFALYLLLSINTN